MQHYLSSTVFYKNDAQLLFKLRTRMANFKANFKNGNPDLSCFLCTNEDRQEHILTCDTIVKEIPEAMNVTYNTIFSHNSSKNKKVFTVIKKALQYRDKMSSND